MNILQTISKESGVAFLERLRPRPRIHFPQLLPWLDEGLKEGLDKAIIEITSGNEDLSGSKILLLNLICRVLLPDTYAGFAAGVLFINTDHHLKVEFFERCLRCHASSVDLTNALPLDSVVQDSLSRLWIMNVFDMDTFEMCLGRVEALLAHNGLISLIAIDSLTAFYPIFRSEKGFMCQEKYILRLVQRLTLAKLETHLVFSSRHIVEPGDPCPKVSVLLCTQISHEEEELHVVQRHGRCNRSAVTRLCMKSPFHVLF